MIQKVVHIVGPTGVGKTDLAIALAKKFDGQLISADSVQVYKGLDIISGKDIPKGSKFKEIKGFDKKFHLGFYSFSKIPIFLLDVVSPSSSFTVYDFKDLALNFISSIQKKGKLPIVVGGTGLYINVLNKSLPNIKIPPDTKLRSKLEKLNVKSLQAKLKKLNPNKYKLLNNSDINNKRRLIRAIEISLETNKKTFKEDELQNSNLQIGLMAPMDYLKEKINKRVEKRLKDGAMSEAKYLFGNYNTLCQQVKDANGYKQLFLYFKKEITLDEAIYRWKISEYHHAKNQMTWFKKFGKTIWFDITKKEFKKDIERKIVDFLA